MVKYQKTLTNLVNELRDTYSNDARGGNEAPDKYLGGDKVGEGIASSFGLAMTQLAQTGLCRNDMSPLGQLIPFGPLTELTELTGLTD